MNSAKPSSAPALTVRASAGRQSPPDWEALGERQNGRRSRWGNSLRRMLDLFKIRPPETEQVLQRIQRMERDLVLPAKVAAVALLLYQFYFTHWVPDRTQILEVPLEWAHYYLWFWIGANLLTAWALFSLRRLRLGLIEWVVFSNSLLDGIFLGVLTLGTGGYNSPLYWVFLALIARTAVSVPRSTSQVLLNLTLSTCYIVAGVMDTLIASKLSEKDREIMNLYGTNPAEPLLLRLALLLLMTFGCYAIQVLLERQRQVAEEAREFAIREVQLRAAGRLAAEFAHQMKNPLAIINTAAFSLQKAIKEGKGTSPTQIAMIQEEVDRADRIITQVMGYAQLSEGHVERLDVIEELDHAIDRVFPPAAGYPIEVRRRYDDSFPPLFMQRRHASETFINVLQNAREALPNGGIVGVNARCLPDQSIEVSIQDNGPGIPPEKQIKIFEAYYTTKERGTGLGLATVKHNLELYGGSIRVESELGKGARFVLIFPAKALMKLAKTEMTL